MKVILSTAPFSPNISYFLKFPRFPVLNLPLLAACIEDRHEVRLVSNLDCRRPAHRLDSVMEDFRPDAVGFSAPSSLGAAAVLAEAPRLIKSHPETKFIAGGPHASLDWERFLAAGFYAVVLGEGEKALPALLEAMEKGGEPEGAAGVAWRRRDGSIAVNPPQKERSDMDSLPRPRRDLLPENREIYGLGRAAAVETSRGCPYDCAFCTVRGFWGGYREKGLDPLLAELSALASEGVRELLFVDHSFGVNPARTLALAKAMTKEKFGFTFGVFFRADTVAAGPEVVRELARAGLRYAIVGFESYSPAELSWMNKKTSPAINAGAASILRKNRVVVLGSHIYFTPAGGVKDSLATLANGLKACDIYKAGAYNPLAGAPSGPLAGEPEYWAERIMDHLRADGGSRVQRALRQAALAAIMPAQILAPGQLLGMLSKDEVKRAMTRREYATMARRILLMAGVSGV